LSVIPEVLSAIKSLAEVAADLTVSILGRLSATKSLA
jgi:hypothetical protein